MPPQIAESSRSKPWSVAYAIVSITILAPLLGGSTELADQAVLAFAAGVLLLVSPPSRSLGMVPNILFAALLVVALSAFLPVDWFPKPHWRNDLEQLGAELPGTRSPQPWLSLQWSALLLLGLSWTYYLLAFPWRERMRMRACQIFCIGILVLALMLIVAFVTNTRVPFWPPAKEFGFFPNRNQTSNVLGLGGVMIYALALQQFIEGRRYWSGWLIALAFICWALIINQSRSGIILLFAGTLAVHLYFWKGMQEQRRPLIAFGGLAVLVALFLINGGATLARFGKETAEFFPTNLRWSFYRDAFDLVAGSSILGNGLGNFRALFGFSRFDSVTASEAAHPESDWLWLAVDLGWPAVLLVIALFAWWISKCRPFDAGTSRLLRVGGLICGCGFAVHGIFDVSGHRPGAFWPAVFLGSIAVHPGIACRSSKMVGTFFRVVGVVLIAVGIWWMSTVFGLKSLPVANEVESIKAETTGAIDRGDYNSVPSLAQNGLRIAPLDWLLYYKRAIAEVVLFQSHDLAVRDFEIARYLNRLWPDLPLYEGEAWLSVNEPDLAIDAWSEALRRAGDRAPNFYADMLRMINSDPVLLDRLHGLALKNNSLLIIYLRTAGPFEFQLESERLLSDQTQLASFSPGQLSEFFGQWYKKGDKLALAETLQQHPEWKKVAWRQLAQVYADYGDYRAACETAQQFETAPQIALADSSAPIEKLGADFFMDRANVHNGLALYFAQLKQGQTEAALATLQQMIASPNSPKYLSYLEAQLWMQKQDWQKAWAAWARFDFSAH